MVWNLRTKGSQTKSVERHVNTNLIHTEPVLLRQNKHPMLSFIYHYLLCYWLVFIGWIFQLHLQTSLWINLWQHFFSAVACVHVCCILWNPLPQYFTLLLYWFHPFVNFSPLSEMMQKLYWVKVSAGKRAHIPVAKTTGLMLHPTEWNVVQRNNTYIWMCIWTWIPLLCAAQFSMGCTFWGPAASAGCLTNEDPPLFYYNQFDF